MYLLNSITSMCIKYKLLANWKFILTYTPYYFNIRVDLDKNGLFFSSWWNERPYAQHPLSKIRFFLSTQQLTLWPSKSENFQKFSKFGATFERVPYHLSNLSGWNYLHFYIKFHIKLRNFIQKCK